MLKIALALMNAQWIVFTKVNVLFIFTLKNAWIGGACEPVCPVEAIFYEDDLPEEWSDYYRANTVLFRS